MVCNSFLPDADIIFLSQQVAEVQSPHPGVSNKSTPRSLTAIVRLQIGPRAKLHTVSFAATTLIIGTNYDTLIAAIWVRDFALICLIMVSQEYSGNISKQNLYRKSTSRLVHLIRGSLIL